MRTDYIDKKEVLELVEQYGRALEFASKELQYEEPRPKRYNVIIFSLEMILYMARWQLSTFTITPVILFAKYIGIINNWEQVALANLISAPIFFFVDKFILVGLRKHIERAIAYFKNKKGDRKWTLD